MDGLAFASVFRSMSDQFTLSHEQLMKLLDAIPCPQWRTTVYAVGVSRLHDYRNYDFIKHHMRYDWEKSVLYDRFGILNVFNPHRPSGTYRLDLTIHEERMVAKMLFDLARQEGLNNFSDMTFNNAAVEKLTTDFIRTNIKNEGIFIGHYQCPEDKIRTEFREQLG